MSGRKEKTSDNKYSTALEKALSELKSILKKVNLTEKESDGSRSKIKNIESGTE